MEKVTVKAHAKINLTLDVVGKRENGYHDVEMIMQSIDLCDDIEIKKTNSGEIKIFSGRDDLPCDNGNLAYKAAAILKEKHNIKDGIEISITKRIPVAAGLAGGSADCAGVLKGINELFELGIDKEELKAIGSSMGKDIPFCIEEGTAFAYGLGDELEILDKCPQMNIVLVKPDINVPTPWAYKMYDKLTDVIHPDNKKMKEYIKTGDVGLISKNMINVLENVTAAEYPIIKEIEKSMVKNGALSSMMSGSGPSVFGIFDTKENADKAAENILKEFNIKETFSTKTL